MNIGKAINAKTEMTYGWVERLQSRHISSNMGALDALRAKVLFYIILFFCILAGLAYIPSVYAAYINQLHDIVIIDTVVYATVIFLLFKQDIGYQKRALTLITIINLLAIFLIWRVGLDGAGFLWLGLAPALSILLLSLKLTIYLWLSNIPILFLLMKTTLTRPSENLHHFEILWTLNSGNFLLISAIVCVSVFVLISGIIQAYKDKEKQIAILEKTQSATIDMLTNLVEFRDNETGNHIIRTKKYVQALANYLLSHGFFVDELNPKKIDMMYCSAALHDVGKVAIPDHVLLKQGKLTTEEFDIMKQHVNCGYQALRKAHHALGEDNFLAEAATISYSHHEKWDGSGYPQGLKGSDIPLSGRIMALADVYDALISERCYKAAFSHEQAAEYIESQAGKHFDPDIVKAFLNIQDQFQDIAKEYSDD